MKQYNILKEISKYIEDIMQHWREQEYTKAITIIKEGLEKYPASSELHYLYLTYLLLLEEDSPYYGELTLEEIKDYYVVLSTTFSWIHFEYNNETLAYLHNVFDEKSDRVESLFWKNLVILQDAIKDFLGNYFSYLNESGKQQEILDIINMLSHTIRYIPTSLLNDWDYYGKDSKT